MQQELKKIFSSTEKLDGKSVEFLTKALDKANLPGFDYLEFKQSLARLQALNMDTATAVKSAFATASTVGLTKEKLLNSSQHYVNVLATEKAQFDSALANQMQKRIGDKQSEVAQKRKQIEQYKAKIAQLEAEINKSQEIIDTADEKINAETAKIEKTKANFEFTFNSILEQIKKDVSDFNSYL